ncbi:hypothetical protein, partial [Deinococcus seoulensis]|uniref:hypothetical protein n=1 Tax=Deinococcus seoulensis TaxID=1837379 RepID=UPI001E4E1D1D
FKFESLDTGDTEDGGGYEQFVLKDPKIWYAGVWIQGRKTSSSRGAASSRNNPDDGRDEPPLPWPALRWGRCCVAGVMPGGQ